jgi:hypothetical protein
VVDSASQRGQIEPEKVGGRGRAYSEAEIRTRDCDAHANCAHQLSHCFTLNHIRRASSQAYTQRGLQLLHTNGASDTRTSGLRGHPEEVLTLLLNKLHQMARAQKRAQRSITVTGCLEKNKRVTSSLKPRCSSNKSSVDRSHSIVTPEQRTGSTRAN